MYEKPPVVNESIKIPREIATIIDFLEPYESEKGNKPITGQQGLIPFILSQLGDKIAHIGKQIIVR